MTPEHAAWLVAALAALGGSAVALWLHVPRPRAGWLLAATVLAAAGAVAGLVWRAVTTAAWPGTRPDERLVLLTLGALVILAWWLALTLRHDSRPGRQWGTASLLASAAILAGAAALFAGSPVDVTEPHAARAWLFGLSQLAAGVGGGGLLVAFALSTATGRSATDAEPGALPPGLSAAHVAALDEGRAAALLCYPWLTAAWLLIGAWNLAAYAALWRGQPGELWLFVAWLLSGAYLHLTSSWRPVRLPGWLPALLAGLAFAAALFAAFTAGSA